MAGDKQVKQESSNDEKQKKIKMKGKSAVASLNSTLKTLPAEKHLETVLSKYSEIIEENLQLQSNCKQMEKAVVRAQTDKEKAEAEHSKAVLTRSRLESLCRELQKQNKSIKDENVDRLKEEQAKRKQVSTQLHSTLEEISSLMDENTTKNTTLREENQKMAVKLQELIKEHQEREERVEKAITHKQLEIQLVEARLAKVKLESTEEKERLLHDKKALLEELSQYQQKVQLFSTNEITLRAQLESYSKKYEEFQGNVDRTNDLYTKFKSDMTGMTKTVKKYEKEVVLWRQKWQDLNQVILRMVPERTEMEKKIETQGKQLEKLQGLCRALQTQNTELRTAQKLAETNGLTESEPPSYSVEDPLKAQDTQVPDAAVET